MRIVIIILLSLIFFQCKPSKPDAAIEEVKLPEDFAAFYNNFHTDSTYQINHITFPLEGVQNANEGKIDILLPIKWEREDWVLHKAFNDHNGTFTRTYELAGPIIIEKISDANNFFAMERRFAKLSGEWHLIYYGLKK